ARGEGSRAGRGNRGTGPVGGPDRSHRAPDAPPRLPEHRGPQLRGGTGHEDLKPPVTTSPVGAPGLVPPRSAGQEWYLCKHSTASSRVGKVSFSHHPS